MNKSYKCNECQLRFGKKDYLKRHVKFVHSEDKPFPCQFCEYRSKYKKNVKRHFKTHFPDTSIKSFGCSECPFKCISNANLKTHLMTHTGEKPFACELCSYRATRRSHIISHTISHTKERPFKCSHCDFTCGFAENLHTHVLHRHTNKGTRPFSCSFPGCDKTYTVNGTLKRHILSAHQKKTRFKCPCCPKEFYSNYVCKAHIRRQHTKETKCNACNYIGLTASDVKRHTAFTHGDFLGLECPVCNKAFKHKMSLAAHRLYAHRAQPREKTRIKCNVGDCEKHFEGRSGLKYHIRAFHLKQKPFKCPFCDYSAVTSTALNSHIKSHTREKPYKCDLCERCFASSSCLATHKATAHSESRPFMCDMCEFSTKTKKGLNRHWRTHYPVPALHVCAVCKESGGSLLAKEQSGLNLGQNYVFRSKSSLQAHMKRHWEEGSYECRPCFVRLDRLKLKPSETITQNRQTMQKLTK